MLRKIVSGGQTGVDRAALDIAIKLNIEHGGWCPKGRLAESGNIIPKNYFLTETYSSDYSERTKLNIRDSDGTLILVAKLPLDINDGTILTIQEVKDRKKPYLIVNLSEKPNIRSLENWINQNNINILNIAGPRESQSPGIFQLASKYLEENFKSIKNSCVEKNLPKKFTAKL